MRVLFDQSTPVPLRAFLRGHAVRTAAEQGWATLKNGVLLALAEEAGFDVLTTPDKNMIYQQNLLGRSIAMVVIGTGRWPLLRPHTSLILEAVNEAAPGAYQEVAIPFD